MPTVMQLAIKFPCETTHPAPHGEPHPFLLPHLPVKNPSMPSVWDDTLLANPHALADKKLRVRKMFAAIAPSYDLNNRLHSFWMDQRWRKIAVRMADLKPADRVLDVACGTGDLALRFARELSRIGGKMPVGVDFTFEMLPIAQRKSLAASRQIAWINGDAMALPVADNSVDVVSIAFGIRNVADPLAACREFRRVLKPGGRLIMLEFSIPTIPPLRAMFNFYFHQILPRTATWISSDKTGAYKYLPKSVNTFIDRPDMLKMIESAGFAQARQFPLTFGICVCYRGIVA